ncbi:MAG TPA: universal stress protein [Chthoniobacterales bacterium]|nr:universal stress protein [Chthoniobacterales bacterium]
MMPPSYRNIAVASTFSPRFANVLAEAKRIRGRFGSSLCLIYVGDRNAETDQKFSQALQQLELPADSRIHYTNGDPAAAILQTVEDNEIDMIIAGALEKEVVLHSFVGNVARRLVREAACSVMLFTEPNTEPKPLQRMVFVADYSDHGQKALKKAIELADREQTERLYVIRIVTTFDEIRAARETPADSTFTAMSTGDEETALEEFVLSTGPTEVPIEVRCIRGNTGFAASDFIQSVSANMLVVPIPPSPELGPNLPPNIAWITDVIPCNLWVIR